MYKKDISDIYNKELNKYVKEVGITKMIVNMNIEMETYKMKELLKEIKEENHNTYNRFHKILSLFHSILENNLDLKYEGLRETLLEKMDKLIKKSKSIKRFEEFEFLKQELVDLEIENDYLQNDYNHLELDYENATSVYEDRYEALWEENKTLKEMVEESNESKLKKRILELERENKNLKSLLENEGYTDVDDM